MKYVSAYEIKNVLKRGHTCEANKSGLLSDIVFCIWAVIFESDLSPLCF